MNASATLPEMIAPPLGRRLKVLLVNPGPEPAPGDRNLPMGLLALAATTRLEHDVRIRDWIYERWSDEEFLQDLVDGGYDVVGLTSMTWQIHRAYGLLAKIKAVRPDIVTIMGGIHPSYLPQEVFDTGHVDFICNGEGEATFVEFLRVHFGGGDVTKVKGMWLKDANGQAFKTPPRELVDLSKMPPPARDLMPIKPTLPDGTPNPAYSDMGGVMFSRGCSANCDFCASPTFWRRNVRFRTVDQMVGEVEEIQRTYGVTGFGIHDDIFTANRKVLYEFCERVKPLRITYTCLARVDQMDEEKLLRMRDSGCVLVSYGVESGNQEVLETEHKNQKIPRVKEIFALHHKHKVPVCALLIVGHVGETVAALRDTYDLIAEIKPTWALVQFMSPYPGTALHFNDIAKNTGTVRTWDWKDYVHQDKPIYVPKDLTPELMLEWRDRIRSLNPVDPAAVVNEWTSTYLWRQSAPNYQHGSESRSA